MLPERGRGMSAERSTRAKCHRGRDVRDVYPATPWKALLVYAETKTTVRRR